MFHHPLAVLRRLWRNKIAVAGLVILLVMVASSTLAPAILPYNPNTADFDNVLHPRPLPTCSARTSWAGTC